ncbi:uncharacterized protein F4807DRAFT_323372 [Annulohypoxylon truncatum]|uniref:uncharacterized protein n=1 Tax=Annulohypoxylon truncatum TaxID=327061 RepID=UPI002008297E|nr:uncharacterized protein F4807DRAFT_323372 [Annulohypoxylon truncatum]KAI1204649.1 hypothetical protein F4807DRAFT_323372 [Annulohypoxylon truncatum]
MYLLAALRSLIVLAALSLNAYCASIPSATSTLEDFEFLTVLTAPSSSPLKQESNSGGNDFGVKVNIGIIVSVAVIFLVILALVVWKRWKESRDLATRIPIQEQFSGLQGAPADRVRAQQIHEMDGNIQRAELSGVRDPSELHDTGICAELPGDHRFPEKTKT